MERNYENEKGNYVHKHSYLTIIAIVLSVISIIFSTFTLVTTRRAPRHGFHASRMAEMPCQMQDGNGFDRPFNMPNQRGNNFNRSERFPSNNGNNWDNWNGKKDEGPKTAPETAPPSSTQNQTPNFQ